MPLSTKEKADFFGRFLTRLDEMLSQEGFFGQRYYHNPRSKIQFQDGSRTFNTSVVRRENRLSYTRTCTYSEIGSEGFLIASITIATYDGPITWTSRVRTK